MHAGLFVLEYYITSYEYYNEDVATDNIRRRSQHAKNIPNKLLVSKWNLSFLSWLLKKYCAQIPITNQEFSREKRVSDKSSQILENFFIPILNDYRTSSNSFNEQNFVPKWFLFNFVFYNYL